MYCGQKIGTELFEYLELGILAYNERANEILKSVKLVHSLCNDPDDYLHHYIDDEAERRLVKQAYKARKRTAGKQWGKF